MSAERDPRDAMRDLRRGARVDGAVWLGLICLVGVAVAAAKTMGSIGFIVAVGVSVVEAGLLAVLFMRLRDATTLVRLAAGLGFALLAAMFTLSLADLFTRT